MPHDVSRRSLVKLSTMLIAAGAMPLRAQKRDAVTGDDEPIFLNLNENAFGPSSSVEPAIQQSLAKLARYADANTAARFAQQVAAYEHVPVDQVLLGEALGGLGLYLSSAGGPGGEFIYSAPGYLALVAAAAHVGGVGVPVPLNADLQNDLPTIRSRVNAKTRATYLINPHNPTGTLSDLATFHSFLADVSQQAPVIVDEAYLEYNEDFSRRSAVSLVRSGANVLVFRTFDKIHGLAGLPIGYTLGPRPLIEALKKQGLGDAEGLGRVNLAAASAALADTAHTASVRRTISIERAKWHAFLEGELKLRHAQAAANFVFFDTGRPHEEVAGRLRQQGIVVARAFPPFNTWVRITIGLPSQNSAAQRALAKALA